MAINRAEQSWPEDVTVEVEATEQWPRDEHELNKAVEHARYEESRCYEIPWR